MTEQEIRNLISGAIEGQGSAIDASGKLPSILRGILDLAAGGENVQSDWNQSDNTKADYIKNKPAIPTVPTAQQTLAALTLESSAASFSSASNLTKESAATALGISEDELDALFEGDYIRVTYGTGSGLSVDSFSAASVSLGKGAVTVSVADSEYAIVVA